MTPLEKIEAEIMELPLDEREALAYRILDTVSGDFATPEIEQAWIEEAKRRIEAIDKGEMRMIPAEEVFAKADALLAKYSHK